jgi:hypothetical protein
MPINQECKDELSRLLIQAATPYSRLNSLEENKIIVGKDEGLSKLFTDQDLEEMKSQSKILIEIMQDLKPVIDYCKL